MGASAWEYYVPYQEDIYQALQHLRTKEFTDSTQRKGYKRGQSGYRLYQANEVPPEWPSPLTIDALLCYFGNSGTHSILDVTWISPVPRNGGEPAHALKVSTSRVGYSYIDNPGQSAEWGGPLRAATDGAFAIWPAGKDELLAFFGTVRPTKEMLRDRKGVMFSYFMYYPVYIVIYSKPRKGRSTSHPIGIYFSGVSGH
jgi:hypothetical protein